jgi:hypothetical protein
MVSLPSGITVPRKGVELHESCPNAEEHDPVPRNMNANGYSPTHRQVKHDICGLYAKWVPRSKRVG